MPELPEVEVTRRAFAAQIAGARIESVALGKPLRWPLGIAPELLAGRDVHGVRRRGKYLLMELSEGLLMLHLGMSGSLRFVAPRSEEHTSELQSQSNLVCRLLLAKKKRFTSWPASAISASSLCTL